MNGRAEATRRGEQLRLGNTANARHYHPSGDLMRVAIHEELGGPSDIWIAWCEVHSVPYRRVDCFADDIIEQLRDCDGLIWWWGCKARPLAHPLTRALEMSGKLVFPDSRSCFHIDDKIAQKYLFEALNLPLPRTHVFYDREKALSWAASADYPKIFKLRSSASSENVWLVRSSAQAKRFIKMAFGNGLAIPRRLQTLAYRLRHLRHQRTAKAVWLACKAAVRGALLLFAHGRIDMNERGYVYFQDVIIGADHSFLVLVSENQAYAVRQTVRTGDYRASGSGLWECGHPRIVPRNVIERAFEIANRLGTPFLALEMLATDEGVSVLETDPFWFMKYMFPGFWDDAMQWHEGSVIPAQLIIGKFVEDLDVHLAARHGRMTRKY